MLGNITESTISDPSFPFGYDTAQFDLCLDLDILKNNLATVTEKVDDEDFQIIILAKLNQVNPLMFLSLLEMVEHLFISHCHCDSRKQLDSTNHFPVSYLVLQP